jgi:hypothetical protein
LTDYQNKRNNNTATATKGAATPLARPTVHISDDEEEDAGDDGGWGDDWGNSPKAKTKGIDDNFDYKNTNLNKLTNEEIAAHKKKMDENFSKNQLKPGDAGFVYDKRIEFTKKADNDDEDEGENSWDEGAEDVDNYFDDDFM